MKNYILPFIICCFAITSVGAQSYFYIDNLSVGPTQPTPSDNIQLDINGNFADPLCYVVNSSVTVTGNVINVTINAARASGMTMQVLVPHDMSLSIGQLAVGTYTINIQGSNIYTGNSSSLSVTVAHWTTNSNNGGYTMNVYPNPTTGFLKVAVDDVEEDLSLEIYNGIGQQLWRQAYAPQIDCTDLPQGVYYMRLRKGKAIVARQVFVKK